MLNVIPVIQTGTSHNIIRFSRLSIASRADDPCKFGSMTGQPHVVLHALFLQLRDALITETTAVVQDVTSPALIIVSFARHGNKGTQPHCCASDSLTSRWWFSTVGSRLSSGRAGLFTVILRSGSALAGSTPPIVVGRAPAASALASAARHRNSSGSGCSRPLSTCISSPAARFSSPSSGWTTGRRRARLGPSVSSGLALTLSPNS